MFAPATEKPKGFRSLTATVALAFLMLSIFVLLISTGLQLFFNAATQRQTIMHQQEIVAQNAADSVSSFVSVNLQMLDQAADLTNLSDSVELQSLVMNKLLGRNPAFRQLFLLDTAGAESYKVSRVSDLTMNPVDQFRGELMEETQAGRNYISPIYVDPVTSEPMTLIAVQVKNIFRDPAGAFVAEVNLKFLWSLVGAIEVGENGQAYVVDKTGHLIAHEDISRVIAKEDLSYIEEVGEFISSTGTDIDVGEIQQGIDKTLVIASFVALGTPDWAVMVEMPVYEAYESIIWLIVYSMLVMALGACVAVVSGMFLARRITRDIVDLNEAARKITGGKLDTRITITSNNEIGQLGASFNAMTAELEQSYKTLEQRVTERTAELASKVTEIEKMNYLMVGRELKMVELKKENERLRQQVQPSSKENQL